MPGDGLLPDRLPRAGLRPARRGAGLGASSSASALRTFPLILTLIGLRARTPAGTAALSGFTQSTGYLIAAIGPFGVGVLHDLSGGWTVPLLALLALCVPQLWLGLAVVAAGVRRGRARPSAIG